MTADPNNLTSMLTDFIVGELASDHEIEHLKPDDDLLDDSLVDSLGIMRLVTFIDQKFNYSVPSEDIVIENFMTVSAIVDYLVPRISEKNAN